MIAYLQRTWATLVTALLACALCFLLGQCDGDRRGRAECEVEWQAASVAAQQKSNEAMVKADTAAIAREAALTNQNEELQREAAKGDDTGVGRGISNTLGRLREQQSRGAGR